MKLSHTLRALGVSLGLASVPAVAVAALPGDGVPGNGVPGNGSPGNGVPGNGSPGNGSPGNGSPGNGSPGNGVTCPPGTVQIGSVCEPTGCTTGGSADVGTWVCFGIAAACLGTMRRRQKLPRNRIG